MKCKKVTYILGIYFLVIQAVWYNRQKTQLEMNLKAQQVEAESEFLYKLNRLYRTVC